jgi:NADPH-dependent glutamate synthase beta subunit-like oxidoreductase
LRAALDLSRRGIPVTIVEKEDHLGGRVATLGEIYPTGERGADVTEALVASVEEDPRITVLKGARIVSASGYVGNFVLSAQREGDFVELPAAEASDSAAAEQFLARIGSALAHDGRLLFAPREPSPGGVGVHRCVAAGRAAVATRISPPIKLPGSSTARRAGGMPRLGSPSRFRISYRVRPDIP